MCCWTGTGASIAANKVAGVRAALCADAETARGARTWNDANVLALSLRSTSEPVLEEILDGWFATAPSDDPTDRANIEHVAELDSERARSLMAVETHDVVATPAEAEQLELAPLIISDSLREYLARELPGDDAPLEFERIGEGHSNITYLVTRGERSVRAAPPAAAAAAAVRARRAARVAHPRRDQGHAGPLAAHAARLRRRVGDRGALLCHGVRGGLGDHERDPRAARHAGGAPPDGTRPRRRAGRGARRRLARVRARGLRQADRLPGAPDQAVHRPVGVQQDARAAAGAGVARLARGEHAGIARRDDRARRLPPRQHDGRRRSARAGDRDLRLGAVDDRRPARRPRLHDRHLDPARRSRGHDVRSLTAVSRARGISESRGDDRPLRGAHGSLDVRPQLVPDARAVEGGGVHGGQLQALARGHHRRPLPEALRRGRARARRGGIRGQPCRR